MTYREVTMVEVKEALRLRLKGVPKAFEPGREWSEQEYGLRRHSTTQWLPRAHFETEGRAAFLPPPHDEYDLPLWSTPKVGRDIHAQVAKAPLLPPLPLPGPGAACSRRCSHRPLLRRPEAGQDAPSP